MCCSISTARSARSWLSPELARIRDGARDAIARLVGRYAVVAIVSGRTGDQLRELVGVEGVRLAALYGLAEDAPPLPEQLLDAVRAAAAAVPGARVEPKGGSVAVHFRAADDARRRPCRPHRGADADRERGRPRAATRQDGARARAGRPAAEGRRGRAHRRGGTARRRALRGRRRRRHPGVRGARPPGRSAACSP